LKEFGWGGCMPGRSFTRSSVHKHEFVAVE
jgi:hypothetical protein